MTTIIGARAIKFSSFSFPKTSFNLSSSFVSASALSAIGVTLTKRSVPMIEAVSKSILSFKEANMPFFMSSARTLLTGNFVKSAKSRTVIKAGTWISAFSLIVSFCFCASCSCLYSSFLFKTYHSLMILWAVLSSTLIAFWPISNPSCGNLSRNSCGVILNILANSVTFMILS